MTRPRYGWEPKGPAVDSVDAEDVAYLMSRRPGDIIARTDGAGRRELLTIERVTEGGLVARSTRTGRVEIKWAG
jgi:hypothetical protein